MSWTEDRRVVALRRRSRLIDLVVELLDGWRLHYMGRNAAVLTYYGFLSIFPLFLVATTILSFVLRDNPDLLQDLLDTAFAQIPVIGKDLQENAGEIGGNGVTVAISLVVALWAATRGFVGLQVAFDDAWEVPIDERNNLAVKRGKALLGILIIGIGLVGATALSSVASIADLAQVQRALLLVGTVVLNGGVLMAMYRYLGARTIHWGDVLPGSVLGGLGFTVLQVLGATLVDRFIRTASDTAGAFATVFGLLGWINLHAQISLVGAELNAALVRRRTRTDEDAQASSRPAGASDAEERPTSTS